MPLPDEPAREALIFHKLKEAKVELDLLEKAQLLKSTEGYSCSDLMAVVKEAAMQPLRELT
jgi:spastin